MRMMKKILNNILHRFKEDSLAKRKGRTERPLEFKNLKDLKKVMVLWTDSPECRGWQKKLTESLKHVKIDKVCFIPQESNMLETDDLVALRNEDIGFGGKIQNERVLALMNREYDLAIDLTQVSNTYINYVLMNSKAACIVGMKKEGGVADIVIDGPTQPIDLISKLIEVLSGINAFGHE